MIRAAFRRLLFAIEIGATAWILTIGVGLWYSNTGAPVPVLRALHDFQQFGSPIDWHALWLSAPVSAWWVQVRALLRVANAAGSTAGLFFLVASAVFSTRAAGRKRDEQRRALAKKTSEHRASQIPIACVPLPRRMEARGVLLAGAPGTGKSQVISSVIGWARYRGDAVICVDRGAEMFARWGREGDTIFNPLDSRSVAWSPLAEIRSRVDADTVARALWPQTGTGDASDYFHACAAQVFSDVVQSAAVHDNGSLARVLSHADQLAVAVKGTVSEQYRAAREWGGIFTTVTARLPWLRYLPPTAGAGARSLRDFVAGIDTKKSAALWVTIPKQFSATLDPLAGLMAALIGHNVLGLAPSDVRRVWLVTDELGQLPRLPLSQLAAEGRKHGLCLVSAVQSVAQVRQTYGRDGAQSALACFGSWLILRQGDEETAEAMSRHLGSKEIREWRQSEGSGSTASGETSSRNRSEQVRVKRSVLARELMELADLEGYLSIGGYAPARVAVGIVGPRNGASPTGFLPRVEAPIETAPATKSAPLSASTSSSKSAPTRTPESSPPALQLGALDEASRAPRKP